MTVNADPQRLQMQTDHARKLPLFWGHGNADPVVRYEWGQQSVNQLKALGFKDIEFKTYPGLSSLAALG